MLWSRDYRIVLGLILPAGWASAIVLALMSASPIYLEFHLRAMVWLWVICWSAGALAWWQTGRVIPRWLPGLVAGGTGVWSAAASNDAAVDRMAESYDLAIILVLLPFVVLSAVVVVLDVGLGYLRRAWRAWSRMQTAPPQSDSQSGCESDCQSE